MATIKNHKNHSTIQIKKDIYFVFGNLEFDGNQIEKIKNSIDEWKKYFSIIEEELPTLVMDWRSGQEGDWVMSDDYRIVQILKRTDSKDPNSYNDAVIRTCVGTFAVNPKTYFDTDFELHPDRYRISTKGKEAYEKIRERDDTTRNEEQFSRLVAQGMEPTIAYMQTYPTKNENYAKDMSRTLMKQERIGTAISKSVEKIMEEEGVSQRYIITNYKKLIDDGILDLKNCAPSVRAALRDLADMAAMMPDKTKQSQSKGVFEEIEDAELVEIEEAEQRAKQKELPDHTDIEEENNIDLSKMSRNGGGRGDEIISEVGQSLLS